MINYYLTQISRICRIDVQNTNLSERIDTTNVRLAELSSNLEFQSTTITNMNRFFLLGDSLSPGNGDLLNIAINAQKTFSLVFTSGETKNMPSPIYAYSIGFSIKRSVSEVYIFLFSRTNNKIATNVWIDGLGWTGWSER